MMQAELPAAAARVRVQPWSAPTLAPAGSPGRRMPEELQGGELKAWHEARAEGHAAGLEAARSEIEARTRRLDAAVERVEQVLQALSRPLAQADDAIHEQIALLATALARALVRRELRTDPTQIIGIVRDTVALLPASARGVRVLLHPEDAALVREKLHTDGAERAWSIVDDPVLGRGDCRVQTDFAQIDARIETRLREALALLLGDERTAAREEDLP